MVNELCSPTNLNIKRKLKTKAEKSIVNYWFRPAVHSVFKPVVSMSKKFKIPVLIIRLVLSLLNLQY